VKAADTGILIQDGGVSIARSFRARRLKALLLLAQHPELDEPDWQGKVELHFGGGGLSVRGSVHPSPHEIEDVGG